MISRKIKDTLTQKLMFSFCILVISLAIMMISGLYIKAEPILEMKSIRELLFSLVWHPYRGNFGLAGFIAGTLWVTIIAMSMAVPVSILTALYLSEYAPKKLRETLNTIIDILAGISPVIYGVWGLIVIVPFVRDYFMPLFSNNLNFFPFISNNYTGFSALTAGIVLAVMVSPLIISLVNEVLKTVPLEIREASLSLGANKWETIKYVVLKKSWTGIIAAIILGLSRAFGETIAVLMVAGCALNEIPNSIFDTAYPLSALIANTYGEMMSIPLYDSAVFLAAFILLLITAIFNIIGWGILIHSERVEP